MSKTVAFEMSGKHCIPLFGESVAVAQMKPDGQVLPGGIHGPAAFASTNAADAAFAVALPQQSCEFGTVPTHVKPVGQLMPLMHGPMAVCPAGQTKI